MRVDVVGSPLAVHRARRELEGPFPAGPNLDRVPQLALVWQSLPAGAPAVSKTFHVTNTAPLPMRVTWSSRVFPQRGSDAEEWASAATSALKNGLVRIAIDPPPAASPFDVTPPSAVIAPGAIAAFTATFASDAVGAYEGVLLGSHEVAQRPAKVKLALYGDASDRFIPPDDPCDDEPALGSPKGGAKGAAAGGDGSADAPFRLSLIGGYHPHAAPPPLQLEPLRVRIEAESLLPRLELDEPVAFECHAPLPDSHSSYRTTFTLTNRQAATLGFKLAAEPGTAQAQLGIGTNAPFTITGVEASVPQDGPHAPWANLPPDLASTVSRARGPFGAALIALPERASVQVSLRFAPPSDLMGQRVDLPGRPDFALDGQLLISFSNGTVQGVPLRAHYVYPQVVVDHPELDFSETHIAAPKSLELILSNPSEADLEWRVTDGEPRQTGEDVGYFKAQPASGRIPGRGLGQPRTAALRITFAPAHERAYSRTLTIDVGAGRGTSVALRGVGIAREPFEVDHRLVNAAQNPQGAEPQKAARLMYKLY